MDQLIGIIIALVIVGAFAFVIIKKKKPKLADKIEDEVKDFADDVKDKAEDVIDDVKKKF